MVETVRPWAAASNWEWGAILHAHSGWMCNCSSQGILFRNWFIRWRHVRVGRWEPWACLSSLDVRWKSNNCDMLKSGSRVQTVTKQVWWNERNQRADGSEEPYPGGGCLDGWNEEVLLRNNSHVWFQADQAESRWEEIPPRTFRAEEEPQVSQLWVVHV